MAKVELAKRSTRNTKFGRSSGYTPSANKPFDDVSDTVDKKEIHKSYLLALERNGGSVDKFINKKRRKYKNGKY